MGIFKIRIVLCTFVCLFFASCSTNSPKRSDEHLKLLKECEKIQKEKDESIRNAVRQLESINHICEQLQSINAEIGDVRIDMTKDGMPDNTTQVEQIDQFIENIKSELNTLESDNKSAKTSNASLTKTIVYLKNIISEKENEAIELKNDLELKDKIIEEQSNDISVKEQVIDKQSNTIILKDQEIKQLQIRKWHDMGTELYKIYEEYYNISKGLFKKRENERRMEDNKRNVLEKAQKCFNEAVSLGSEGDRSNLKRISDDLNSLKNTN